LARRTELLKYRSSSASLRREGEGEMTGLVELAQRYVALSAKLEETRNAMRDARTNGSDRNATRAGSSGPPNKGMDREAFLAQSKAMDEQVLALLREKPMKVGDIARATRASRRRTAACKELRVATVLGLRRSLGAGAMRLT
jgi:hypothetical protein